MEVKKKGYLLKQGHWRRNWLNRWWVLSSTGTLTYSENDKATRSKGALQLKDYTVRVGSAADTKKTPTEFIIHLNAQGGGKDFIICAQSAKERDGWVAALALAAEEARRTAEGILSPQEVRQQSFENAREEQLRSEAAGDEEGEEEREPDEDEEVAEGMKEEREEEEKEEEKEELGGIQVKDVEVEAVDLSPDAQNATMEDPNLAGGSDEAIAVSATVTDVNADEDEDEDEDEETDTSKVVAGVGRSRKKSALHASLEKRNRSLSTRQRLEAKAVRAKAASTREGIIFVGAHKTLMEMVSPQLENAGATLTAIRLGDGVDEGGYKTVIDDPEDEEAAKPLFEACKAVVISTTAYESLGEAGTERLLDRIDAYNVGYVVVLSFVHTCAPALPMGQWKAGVVERLRRDRLPYIDLRFQVFYHHLASILPDMKEKTEEVTVTVPFQGEVSLVDRADVVDALVQLLLDPAEYEDQEFTLTGPDCLSLSDMSEILSEAAPVPISLVYEQEAGSEVEGHSMVVLSALAKHQEMEVQSAHVYAQISDDIETLLDKTPTAFREFAVAHFA